MSDIFEILYTKENNKHYLDRYVKFIKYCQQRQTDETYFESHHIAPKAKDLFPELINEQNNLVNLTSREHIIAHVILWKAYGGSQIYALDYILNRFNAKSNPMYLHGRKIPLSIEIRYAAKAREAARNLRKGKATYKDSDNNKYLLDTNDPLIQELNLVGYNMGLVMSEEAKENMSGTRAHILYNNVTRKKKKIKGKNNTDVQKLLDSGWSYERSEEWSEELRIATRARITAGAIAANTGSCSFYFPDGTLYGRIKKDDPIIQELNLRYIPSELQIEVTRQSQLKATEAKIGTNIWTDGVDEKFSKECPGEGWIIGRKPRSEEWETKRSTAVSSRIGGSTTWNDGIRNYRVKNGDKPDPSWVKGMKPQGPGKKKFK